MFDYIVNSARENGEIGYFPESWQPRLANDFYLKHKANGYESAKHGLINNLQAISGHKLDIASDYDSICNFAKERVNECNRVLLQFKDKDLTLKHMLKVTARYDIFPIINRNVTNTGLMLRLLDESWWRRNLSNVIARNVEAAAINIGMVSSVTGLYASEESVQRRRKQKIRNTRILSSTNATNDNGETFTLQELSDLGVSNPKLRRMELMTRINGFDQVAIARGHAAGFITLTAPSKYHARHHITGKVNPNFNGSTPRDTQEYLRTIWARIRAQLARDNIHIYGFRVSEPHHDGTPHWHMLLYTEKNNVKRLNAIIKHYALAEDGTEKGAEQHRYKYEPIDRKKGSGAAYIAKYISKNIDGYEVGQDYEAINASAAETAERVDTWASTWGIRQFQQIGGQSVTLWRELRRAEAEAIESETLKAIAEAADVGAWDKFTHLNGGEFKLERKVVLQKIGSLNLETGEMRLNKYGEADAPRIVGVAYQNEVIHTRTREWIFQRVGPAETPRSSVNNCTQQLATIEKAAQMLFENEQFMTEQIKESEKSPYCTVDFNWKLIYQRQKRITNGYQ